MTFGDRVYTVKLSVKEYRNDVFSVELPENMRLHHHRIEKERAPATASVSTEESADRPKQPDAMAFTVRELLLDVKDSGGVPFNTLRLWCHFAE